MKVNERKVKNLIKKIHPNLWADIVTKYNEGNIDPIGADCKYETRTIKDIFPPKELEGLAEAIKYKQDYHITKYYYGRSPNGRDYSVEVKLCEDGTLRGWFSSEYKGCGNGDYYILINATQAVFVEKD